MNLRFVETFLWVARLGSFRAAAERLNMTQASVSNRIAALEQELGQILFDRLPGGIRLTQVGLRALTPAEDLLRAAAEFRDAVAEPAALRDTISVGTIDSIVHSWLPRFIERAKRRFPGLLIDLTVDTSLNIGREIAERRVDLALLMGPVLVPGVRNIELGGMECVWVAAPSFGLGGKNLRMEDLAQMPVMAFSRGSIPNHWLRRQFEELGVRAPKVSTSNSLASKLRMTCDGLGIAALPRAILGDLLSRGALETFEVTPPFPPLLLHAVLADHQDNPVPAILAAIAQDVARENIASMQ